MNRTELVPRSWLVLAARAPRWAQARGTTLATVASILVLGGIVAQQLIKTADGKGRVAAQEILLGSHAVAAMIRENKTFQLTSMMQAGKGQGMQTMDLCLERLVRSNTVTPAAALEKAEDKDAFRKLFPVLSKADAAHET